MDPFSIASAHARVKIPRASFVRMKKRILGGRYDLSLVFVGDARMRTLNKKYRGKNATTDILSFPLSKKAGEMFISEKEAARRAKNFSMTPRQYLGFLFIHGCLHLKGIDHGRVMERKENALCRALRLPLPHPGKTT